MKPLAHQPAKKKASSNPVIPQKLYYEKSEKELNAEVQNDVKSFFKKVRKQREARENPEKKTRAGKGVAQLGQQSQQSVPLLSFVMNMVQT